MTTQQVGILLANTGTPNSCQAKDVKRYLDQFLLDGRVIDLPLWLREIVVKCFIIPFRYKKSALAYAKIWTNEGSPLMVHSKNLLEAMRRKMDATLAIGMRYGSPSISEGLSSLKGCQHIAIVPLFPQYASASSGSIIQEALSVVSSWQVIPSLSVVGPFSSDSRFIHAWLSRIREYDLESYDDILFSFHGVPLRHIKKADLFGCCLRRGCCDRLTEKNSYCYQAQCKTFVEKIAHELQLTRFTTCFQSRLGIERWLTPYTAQVIKERAKQGKKRLLVITPSFVADCLETLYEIGQEYKHQFLVHGGQSLDLVTSLNSDPIWVDALADIISEYIPHSNPQINPLIPESPYVEVEDVR